MEKNKKRIDNEPLNPLITSRLFSEDSGILKATIPNCS